jgi:hypothetical protein
MERKTGPVKTNIRPGAQSSLGFFFASITSEPLLWLFFFVGQQT